MLMVLLMAPDKERLAHRHHADVAFHAEINRVTNPTAAVCAIEDCKVLLAAAVGAPSRVMVPVAKCVGRVDLVSAESDCGQHIDRRIGDLQTR